jgi:hypothetical protein
MRCFPMLGQDLFVFRSAQTSVCRRADLGLSDNPYADAAAANTI